MTRYFHKIIGKQSFLTIFDQNNPKQYIYYIKVKKTYAFLYFLVLISLTISSCSNPSQDKTTNQLNDLEAVDTTLIAFKPEALKENEIVFYNLFSPVDFTYLVAENNAYFNSQLINPINNITKYSQSAKIALNLGIYGADISYLWMFNQSQQALSYRSAIQRLTDQLEIPMEMVDFTFETAENNSHKFDTLVSIARKTYQTADDFLKESGREHSAALILLGGWLETMYIATNMYENPDATLLARIAIQKFSINSLYQVLQQHQEKADVAEYLILLRKLKKVYDENTINFPAECLKIDPVAKQIKLVNPPKESITHAQYKEIQLITAQIRNHVIN
ncbi:MAG: hypothetical protein WCX31_13655 [Salinivirgaceae bacterium]|jgi:hypothetical protein